MSLNIEKLMVFIRSILSEIPDKAKRAVISSEKDITLEVDRILNEKITSFLDQNYDFPVISEESERSPDFLKITGKYWILDPLDGSMNFYRNIPISCISLALWKAQEPFLGIIYDFNRDEMFYGNASEGSFLNNKRIGVSIVDKINQGVLFTGFPYGRRFDSVSLSGFVKGIQRWKKVRLVGSAALSLSWVACGRADAYIEEDIRIWDVAAGLAIVKAAGGEISIEPRDSINHVNATATNGHISVEEVKK